MKPRRLSCVGALVAVGLTGCQTPPAPQYSPLPELTQNGSPLMQSVAVTNRVKPEWLRPHTNAFTLGPGDRLEIELLGEPATRDTVLVGPDGKIYFYLVPGLDVWGLTLAQAKESLQRELLKFIRENPIVALNVRTVESRRVWLLGRFSQPGVHSMPAPMTLLEAISLAGGPAPAGAGASLGGSITVSLTHPTEDAADLHRGFLMRQGRLLPVDFHRLIKQGDLTQNIYLEPDDFVYLPSAVARDVHVLGAVGQPRAVAYSDRTTLVSAVAGAGGTIKDAYLSHVAIVRGSLTSPQIAVVDYKSIVRGLAPDVTLQPHDIVYVPFSPYRILGRYVDMILQTFVRTIGANAGARAVVPGSTPIGPNVPIGFSVAPAGQ